MRAELDRMPRSFEPPGPSDPERAKKLAALGYLTAASPAASRTDLPDPKDRIGELAETTRFQTLLVERRDAELVEASRRFLDKNPAALDTWRLLADALARRGDLSGAIAALERGLRQSSATTIPSLRRIALQRLCVLLVAAGRDAEALAIAEAEPPVDPEAWNAVGVARMRARQPGQAREAFERALALDPSDSRTHWNLGRLQLETGDAAQARIRLEEAVRLDPRFPAAWNALGTARAALGDEAGAMECWRRALEIGPTEYGALFNLGIAAGRQGDIAEARRSLQLFVARAPRAGYPREHVEARRILRSLGAR
jgi:tetratricopeptide (TPR) repeat protein